MYIDSYASLVGKALVPQRRITANLPAELLKEAQSLTDQGITETLVLGLQALVRAGAAEKAKGLRGRLHLKEDAGRNHGRHRG